MRFRPLLRPLARVWGPLAASGKPFFAGPRLRGRRPAISRAFLLEEAGAVPARVRALGAVVPAVDALGVDGPHAPPSRKPQRSHRGAASLVRIVAPQAGHVHGLGGTSSGQGSLLLIVASTSVIDSGCPVFPICISVQGGSLPRSLSGGYLGSHPGEIVGFLRLSRACTGPPARCVRCPVNAPPALPLLRQRTHAGHVGRVRDPPEAGLDRPRRL